MLPLPDIGNRHIRDYYLWREFQTQNLIRLMRQPKPNMLTVVFKPDFDIDTEQREGRTYQ
jgi:hypothetical protein